MKKQTIHSASIIDGYSYEKLEWKTKELSRLSRTEMTFPVRIYTERNKKKKKMWTDCGNCGVKTM